MFENQQLLDTKMNSSLSRLNQLEEEIASGNAFNKQVSLLLTSCQHFNDLSRLISSNFQQLSNLYGGNGNLFNLITHKTMEQIISDVNEQPNLILPGNSIHEALRLASTQLFYSNQKVSLLLEVHIPLYTPQTLTPIFHDISFYKTQVTRIPSN